MEDTLPVENAQDVSTVATQPVQEQQVTSIDLSGVVDGIKRTDDDVNAVGAKLTDGIDGVAGQIDDLSKATDDLANEVRASNERNEQQTTTMLVDDVQWSEMRQAWWQARDTLSVAFFLELTIALLLAASLGAQMWVIFSKGWRR